MRRLTLLVMALVALLGLTLVGTADAATSKTHTVTRTVGPYNGAAELNEPGSVPDGEAKTVSCGAGESIISGSAKIKRKTSHGTTSRDVLTLDVIGAFWDPEVDTLKWGAFIEATGRKGWNSVTLKVTCRR
jgi:hypothetical protein